MFSLMFHEAWAQPASNPSLPIDRPLNAENAWPEGEFGMDYNSVDERGFRHGRWVRVYPDGALYYTGEFMHGVPMGRWWYFRENGTALSLIEHRDQPSISDVKMYDSKGRVTARGSYLHPDLALKGEALRERPETPSKHGAWTLFSEEGHLISMVHYDNGIKHGRLERYLPNGTVCEQGNYHHGEMDGEWKAWNDYGALRQRVTYDKGILHGRFETYDGQGGRMAEGQYVGGAEDGNWKYYLEDGRLQSIVRFNHGKRTETMRVNGTFVDWHGEDRPAFERTYRDRVLDGPFREWHDQGEHILERVIDPTTGEELQQRVIRGTQVSREGEYVEGVLDGEVFLYDTRGLLSKTELWNMGVLEDVKEH